MMVDITNGRFGVLIGYTNYRGEYSRRKIVPARVWFGSTEWHPEEQWLLEAYDVEKGAVRDFALRDVVLALPPFVPIGHLDWFWPVAFASFGAGVLASSMSVALMWSLT